MKYVTVWVAVDVVMAAAHVAWAAAHGSDSLVVLVSAASACLWAGGAVNQWHAERWRIVNEIIDQIGDRLGMPK